MRFATWRGWITVAAAALLGSVLLTVAVAQPASDVPPRPPVVGYLGADALPDHTLFLPPPPAGDSPHGVADLAVFRATRSLENGARWQRAATSWLYALLLAEADPANAAAITARGRTYGESRVVCGVHYVSDVEAGRTLAAVVVAALHGTVDFAADMAAARTELGALRVDGAPSADGERCSAEEGELRTPW